MTPSPAQRDRKATDLGLLLLLFKQTGRASQALQVLKKQSALGRLAVLNSAALVRDQSGETFLFETGPVDPSYAVLFGGILGAMLGVMSGLVDTAADPAPVAARGDASTPRSEIGSADEYLLWLQARFQPGGSALVVLVERDWVERGLAVLNEFGAQVLQQTITDDILTRFATGTERVDVKRQASC
jgi:uncharacterized membrane protein